MILAFREVKIFDNLIPQEAIIEEKVLYVVYYKKLLFGVKYMCPCGCGVEMWLRVNGYSIGNIWDLTFEENDTISLSPSVRHLYDCKSHYWIRKNKVIWCSDSPVLRKR